MTFNQSTDGQRVLIFFGATYGFSWALMALGHYTQVLPFVLLGVWGPTLVATGLTTYYYGRSGLREMLGRFGRVRVGLQWWLVLLFLPAAVHLVGRSLWQLMGPGELDLQLWFSVSTVFTSVLIAGLGEELGWRGFALPRLQALFSPLMASVLLAGVHFFWHLPTYWLGQGIHNVPLVYAVGFMVPWTVIYTWVYNRSGGSLLFAVGFHAISNTFLSVVRFMPLDAEVPISPDLITQVFLPGEYSGPYLSVVAVYWVVALIVVGTGGLTPANTDTP